MPIRAVEISKKFLVCLCLQKNKKKTPQETLQSELKSCFSPFETQQEKKKGKTGGKKGCGGDGKGYGGGKSR